jgi:hypothetical protein
MARQTITAQLACRMLDDYGLAIIWKLHVDAATLYRIGNAVCAATFIEIAEAAEREWMRRAEVDARNAIS